MKYTVWCRNTLCIKFCMNKVFCKKNFWSITKIIVIYMLSFGSKQLSTSLSLLKSYIWITEKLLRLLKIVLSGKTHFIKYKFIKKNSFSYLFTIYITHKLRLTLNVQSCHKTQIFIFLLGKHVKVTGTIETSCYRLL